jgi:hypothetical protein
MQDAQGLCCSSIAFLFLLQHLMRTLVMPCQQRGRSQVQPVDLCPNRHAALMHMGAKRKPHQSCGADAARLRDDDVAGAAGPRRNRVLQEELRHLCRLAAACAATLNPDVGRRFASHPVSGQSAPEGIPAWVWPV